MPVHGWSPATLAALQRLREAGEAIDPHNPHNDARRTLGAAAAVIYADIRDPGADEELPAALAEVRLLAGSIVMAVRHDALGSVALVDTIDRLAKLIGG